MKGSNYFFDSGVNSLKAVKKVSVLTVSYAFSSVQVPLASQRAFLPGKSVWQPL